MKQAALVIVALVILLGGGYLVFSDTREERAGNTNNETTMSDYQKEMNLAGVSVTAIAHATVALAWDGTTIYTDPVDGADVFEGVEAPDLILVTDIHGDHLNVETLEALISDDTVIVAPQAAADQFSESLMAKTVVLANGETTEQKGIAIEALPMYNLPETEDSRHPKGRGNGYVLEKGGTRVYVAGDTDDIPEMRSLSDIDLAFVPMNPPYTMDITRAADGVVAFAPRFVAPYHYRTPDGFSDVEQFRALVNAENPDIEVVLLKWY